MVARAVDSRSLCSFPASSLLVPVSGKKSLGHHAVHNLEQACHVLQRTDIDEKGGKSLFVAAARAVDSRGVPAAACCSSIMGLLVMLNELEGLRGWLSSTYKCFNSAVALQSLFCNVRDCEIDCGNYP